jgi:hypothetical protein
LLTVHLSITLVNDQLEAPLFYFVILLLQSLHVSSNVVLIIRRSNYTNAASGVVNLLGGLPVCRSTSTSTSIPDGHLQTVTIPDAVYVLVKFELLMMSTTLLETCRGL